MPKSIVTRDAFRKCVSLPTRFRDTDAVGHVNSAVYHTYFEFARMDYFISIGMDDYKHPGKFGPVVASQTCNYLRQIFHPCTLDIAIRCVELREKTFFLEYGIWMQGEDAPMADGTTVGAWVDFETARAVPIPDGLRAGIEAFEGRSLAAI